MTNYRKDCYSVIITKKAWVVLELIIFDLFNITYYDYLMYYSIREKEKEHCHIQNLEYKES